MHVQCILYASIHVHVSVYKRVVYFLNNLCLAKNNSDTIIINNYNNLCTHDHNNTHCTCTCNYVQVPFSRLIAMA